MNARDAYEAAYPAAKLARNGDGYAKPFGGMWAVWQAAVASRAPAVADQVDTAPAKKFTTDEAREYLVEFMERHFSDKTFHRYIRADPVDRSRLAGDFAWQMATALRRLASKPVEQVDALSDEQVFHGVKSLLNCTTSEVEDFSPKMMAAYSADVQRIWAAILAAAQPAAPRPTDDELWDKTMRDRDTYHAWADNLAAAIGTYFGVDIGEHSSANNPWAAALDAVPAQPAAPVQEAPEGKTFADGIEFAAAWIDRRREDFETEHGIVDWSTGTLEYGTGAHAEAKREYSGELAEIAEGIRALAAPAPGGAK